MNATIDEPLTAKLTPEILRLRAESSEPITLFIDSFGGSTDSLSYLLDILRATNAGQQPCKIITNVIGHASSAAAVLLVNGDYAVAYPHATIHFHGVRVSEAQNLTVEEANRFVSELNRINKANALDLSQNFIQRMLRLYTAFLQDPAHSTQKISSPIAEVDLFFSSYLAGKVSPAAQQILNDTVLRARDSVQLLQKIRDRQANDSSSPDDAETYAIILYEVISHEFQRQNLRDGELTEDILMKIITNYQSIRNYYCGAFDNYLAALTEKQKELFSTRNLQTRLNPLFGYTIYLCHRLQKDENAISAQDAYWLGVVDEVLAYDLPADRKIPPENKIAS